MEFVIDGCNGAGTRINSFALVSYLPDPLAGFLDRLRADLVQECHAKAHVTVLPPRPLGCRSEEAWEQLRTSLQDVQPFRVELSEIEIFPVTQVIYLSIGPGHAELERLHRKLNSGLLEFAEPFSYHPHITLAQDLAPASVPGTAAIAARRWSEFQHERSFTVDLVTFVQNTLENYWTDLEGCALDHSNISI
jgi:2'-5' RNA ligase